MKILCSVLLALSLASPVAAQDAKVARVALVISAPGAAANSLVDLAQAKLSGQRGIELLERQAIARALQEQKLSLSGLVDAATAVAAGKLLRADLFALVEMDPAGKEALGLVIYDSGSGVKLHDAPLPPGEIEAQVEEVAAGVRRAAEKRAGGLKGLRTVCFLGARNADLPRAQDSLGQTIAYLLERRLLAAPNLALLERKRLDWVNKEKTLPAAGGHQDLLASLALVEVEISRAKNGPGIRAAAFVTDSEGKDLGKVEVTAAQPEAADLAAALQKALFGLLKAEPSKQAADPRRESRRFHHEGKRLATHKEWPAAAQALEAGHALDAADRQVRADLARALGESALFSLESGSKLIVKEKFPHEKLKPALVSALRSLDLRLQAVQQLPDRKFSSMLAHQVAHRDIPMHMVGYNLSRVDKTLLDEEAQDLRLQFKEQVLRCLRAELEAWAELTRRESSPERSSSAFHYYTMAMTNVGGHLLAAGLSRQEADAFFLPLHRQWLEVSRLPGATCPPHSVHQYCQDRLAQRDYPDLFEQMAKHPHLIVNLNGRLQGLTVRAQAQKVSAAQAQIAFQEIQEFARKAIVDHRPDPRLLAQDDLRISIYHFLFDAIDKWTHPSPDQRFRERFALLDFMLDREELVVPLVLRAAQHDFNPKDPCHQQRLELIDRALKLAGSDRVQLCIGKQVLPVQLQDYRKQILAQRPDLAKKLVPSTPPWKDAVQLLRRDKQPGTQFLGVPVVADDSAYVPGWGVENGKIRLRLFQVSLTSRDPTASRESKRPENVRLLGKVDVKDAPKVPVQVQGFHDIGVCCLAKDQVFVGTPLDGIYAFDIAGGPGRRISQDLPSQEVQALAFFEGKLYAGLRGGYLVALDPATGKFDMLASSRRRERLSPFDDAESFRIPYIVADPPRRRLLFLLYQRPSQLIYYAPFMIPSKDTTNGLWEYDLTKKTFQRHLELYYETFLWGSPVRAGHILMSKTGLHHSGVMDFDLAKNEGKLLWAVNPIGPYIPKEKALSREDYYPLRKVQLIEGDWLWCAEPFCRVSLTKRQQELFAVPSGDAPATHPNPCLCIEPVGADRLLVVDYTGLWLLRFEPIAKKVQTP